MLLDKGSCILDRLANYLQLQPEKAVGEYLIIYVSTWDLQSLRHLLSALTVAAFLHHYITINKDLSAPKSLTRGLPVIPLSFCHICASCRLPNRELGSRDGFRLRQNRKLSRSVGCQVITVLVEALLPAAVLCGRQRKGINISRSWLGSRRWSLPFAWSISYCCSSWWCLKRRAIA